MIIKGTGRWKPLGPERSVRIGRVFQHAQVEKAFVGSSKLSLVQRTQYVAGHGLYTMRAVSRGQ